MAESEKGAAVAPVTDPTEAIVAQAREVNAQLAAESRKAANEAADKAAAAERERIAAIYKVVRRHQERTGLGDDFADKLIKSGATVEKVNEIVLRELERAQAADEIDGHVRFEAGDDVRDKYVRGGVASILQRSGHSRTVAAAMKNPLFADQFRGVSVDPGEFAGWKLRDLARRALELRGVSLRGLSDDMIVRRALEHRGDAGQQGVGDFPVLLEAAAHKIFLGRYEQTPVTWRSWCGVKPLQDFNTSSFYRPGTFSVLDDVSEHGEVQHKKIPDGEKATITPATKGNVVGLSRKAIVNDDMGVFNDLIGGLGDAAAETIEKACYAFLTANSGTGANYPGTANPLFHSTRSNIGSTGAMTVATIDSARAKMRLQKDPAGNVYLNLRPQVLLVPVELEGLARQLLAAEFDPSKTTNVPNYVRGMISPDNVVSSGYLSAQSAYRHYFFADPGRYPVVAVGFVNGQEAPQVMQYQSPEYDGIRIRILHDHGEAIIDYRGGVTCAGQ